MLNPNFWQWMSLFHSPEQITLPVNNIPVKKEENDVFYSVNVPTNRGIEQEVSIDQKQKGNKQHTVKPLVKNELQLYDPSDSQYQEQKRGYRKRRLRLKIRYNCPQNGCHKNYGSMIALRNHERTKHGVWRRQKKDGQEVKYQLLVKQEE